MPVGENQRGSVRRITYSDGKVKIQNPIHMTQMQEKLYKAGVIDDYGNMRKSVDDSIEDINLNAEQRQKKRPDIDRDEVVFSGQNGESFEIREIDRYTERQYNNYGWAIVNHVLTGKEQSKLFAQFADKENLNVRYRKSYDGYYMIPVGEYYSYNNKIVFIDGTNQNPIIDRILFVTGDSEYEIGCYVDEVIENEGQLQLLSYIEDYAGKEIFKWNTLSNFETFGRIKEARQRYSTTSSKTTCGLRWMTRSRMICFLLTAICLRRTTQSILTSI